MAAFHPWRLLDHPELLALPGDPVQDSPTDVSVRDLPASEGNDHLGLVPLLEEALDVPELELVVVLFRLGAELHLLDDHMALVLARFGGLLLLFILVLPEVHDLADRGDCLGAHLDQVEPRLLCEADRLMRREHTELLAVRPDHSNLGYPDTPVDADFLADGLRRPFSEKVGASALARARGGRSRALLFIKRFAGTARESRLSLSAPASLHARRRASRRGKRASFRKRSTHRSSRILVQAPGPRGAMQHARSPSGRPRPDMTQAHQGHSRPLRDRLGGWTGDPRSPVLKEVVGTGGIEPPTPTVSR